MAPSCTATSLSASPITMTTTSLVKPGNNVGDQLIIMFPIASDAKRVLSPSGVPPMIPVCVTAAPVTHDYKKYTIAVVFLVDLVFYPSL